MALDFPSSPTLNQIILSEGLKYIWNGAAWVGYSSEISYSQADLSDIDAGDIFVTGFTTTANLVATNAQIDFLTGTNANISGVSTFSNVVVGGATTELLVEGDVRITGILTIGTSSITLNGTDNQITIGAGTTIDSSGGANYAGVITAQGFSGDGAGLINIPTSQWIDVDTGIGVTSIYAAGNVGVATTNPSVTFQVGGNPLEGNDGVGISSSGNINSSGIITATSFVKSSGTSAQFLKADGSVDSNTYLTSYTETDTLDSVTTRGNSTANGLFVGIVTATSLIKSGGTSSQFLKADGSVDSNTYLTSYTETDTLDSVTTRGSTTSNNISVGIATATSISVGIATATSVGIGTTNSILHKLHIYQPRSTLVNPATTELVKLETTGSSSASLIEYVVGGDTIYAGGFGTSFVIADTIGIPATVSKIAEFSASSVDIFTNLSPTSIYANGTVGTAGSILSSTGSGIEWITAPGGFSVTDDTSTNSTYYPVFVDATTGDPTQISVSSTKLNFNPSTGNFSATQFTSLSDVSSKTNIRPVENAIEITKQLQGVKFDWIDNNTPSVGVIAQDVEKVLPELVTNTDPKTVNYDGLIGVLIEAIKEQQVRIEELERRLNEQSI